MCRPEIICVLYNPTVEQVRNKLCAATDCHITFVDNTPAPQPELVQLLKGAANVTYTAMGCNAGIGAAQNRGIRMAMEAGATHFVFFDQDSTIQHDYARLITEEYENLRSRGVKVGALGPRIVRENEVEYASRFHSAQADENCFISRRDIISSGSVVARDVVEQVGVLDASLFIDVVDHEWCWRMRRHGFVVGQTTKLHLTHKVGQADFTLWRYQAIISAPWRYFYQGRNYMWLLRRGYVPLSFKLKGAAHHTIHIILYPFMVKHGCTIIAKLLKGLFYGLIHSNKPDFAL